MKILLIEDNQTIVKGLKYSLENKNYLVEHSSTIKEAKGILNDSEINLVILDISLPDGNGIVLYKNIILQKKIPVIFLTAIDDEDCVVECLELGADEYLTKPFSTKELLARINRIISRNHSNSLIKIDDITYNYDKMEISKNNLKIELTALETQLVNLLFLNINKIVSRNKILYTIWEITGNDVDDHTITVYFKRIREKIGSDLIKTIKGIGYRIDYEK